HQLVGGHRRLHLRGDRRVGGGLHRTAVLGVAAGGGMRAHVLVPPRAAGHGDGDQRSGGERDRLALEVHRSGSLSLSRRPAPGLERRGGAAVRRACAPNSPWRPVRPRGGLRPWPDRRAAARGYNGGHEARGPRGARPRPVLRMQHAGPRDRRHVHRLPPAALGIVLVDARAGLERVFDLSRRDGAFAPLTGMLLDRWGPRFVYPAGLALLGTGCLLAGHLTQLWQFQACIGILNGMGVSMLGMVPASMLISRWFRDRMSTAMGIAYAGFGTGTLVIVPLAQYLIGLHGWRETYRLMGLGILALLPLLLAAPWRRLAAGPAQAPRRKAEAAEETRPWRVRSAMKTRAYWQLVQVF